MLKARFDELLEMARPFIQHKKIHRNHISLRDMANEHEETWGFCASSKKTFTEISMCCNAFSKWKFFSSFTVFFVKHPIDLNTLPKNSKAFFRQTGAEQDVMIWLGWQLCGEVTGTYSQILVKCVQVFLSCYGQWTSDRAHAHLLETVNKDRHPFASLVMLTDPFLPWKYFVMSTELL